MRHIGTGHLAVYIMEVRIKTQLIIADTNV